MSTTLKVRITNHGNLYINDVFTFVTNVPHEYESVGIDLEKEYEVSDEPIDGAIVLTREFPYLTHYGLEKDDRYPLWFCIGGLEARFGEVPEYIYVKEVSYA